MKCIILKLCVFWYKKECVIKMTNEKVEKSNKTKMVAIIGVIAIVIVALGVFIMLSPTPAIYDGDMELSGVIITGEYVSFSANKGDMITIKISNFQSDTGNGFMIHLYDERGISLWSRSNNNDVTYTLEITETRDYQLKFSVNAVLFEGEVSFHLTVKKG